MRSGIAVGEIMNVRVVTAKPNMTVREAAKLANKYRIGGLPVITEKKKLTGVITERDIMTKVVAKNRKPEKVKVKDIMTSPPKVTSTPDEDMNSVAKKMSEYDVSRMPVVTENKKLVGIVTNKDVIENAPRLIDVLLEQARLKGPEDIEPIAFGVCEECGEKGALSYSNGEFLCEECLSKLE